MMRRAEGSGKGLMCPSTHREWLREMDAEEVPDYLWGSWNEPPQLGPVVSWWGHFIRKVSFSDKISGLLSALKTGGDWGTMVLEH